MKQTQEAFIQAHLNDDIRQLALQASRYPEVDMPDALCQIRGFQAIRQKVPTWYACQSLRFPPALSLEQSSSELTARYKASLLDEFLPMERRKSGVDLSGGLGVDTYFLSETFEEYIYVERQALLCELAEHNFEQLGRRNIRVHCAEAEVFLQSMAPVDFIFVDPARRDDKGNKVFALPDCSPDVSALLPRLREKCRLLMIKLSPMLDISLALSQLETVTACHVLALDNDCKELLLLCDFSASPSREALSAPLSAGESSSPAGALPMRTRNFRSHANAQATAQAHTVPQVAAQCFDYLREDEANASCHFASQAARYLYEPNVALLKAGAYKLPSERFGLKKLHQHTHLYTSDELLPHFPGRIFQVQEVLAPSAKVTKQRLQSLGKMNVSVRNYPESVDLLRKKYRIKEGGQLYLFAATLDHQRVLLLCEKVAR